MIVQRILGHEQISTTLDIYTHIDTEDLRGAVERMENAV